MTKQNPYWDPMDSHAWPCMVHPWAIHGKNVDPKTKSTTNNRKSKNSTLTVGTWNVRGLRSKILDIGEFLEKKDVDICALQETKTNDKPNSKNNYKRLLFERSSKSLGLGFLVKECKCDRLRPIRRQSGIHHSPEENRIQT